jgi:hypothetical protein
MQPNRGLVAWFRRHSRTGSVGPVLLATFSPNRLTNNAKFFGWTWLAHESYCNIVSPKTSLPKGFSNREFLRKLGIWPHLTHLQSLIEIQVGPINYRLN